MSILDFLGKEILYFDGAMGTRLQAAGLKPGELPEVWNITHGDVVAEIHASYVRAGANILKSNTFGANALKMQAAFTRVSEECNDRRRNQTVVAREQAGAVCSDSGEEFAVSKPQDKQFVALDLKKQFVALDLGPTGKLLAPYGDLQFEEAVALYAEQVRAGVKANADLVLVETMSDSYEAKAAILAAKENSDLPVFVTFTFDRDGKLLNGADVETAVLMAEGLGVGNGCADGGRVRRGRRGFQLRVGTGPGSQTAAPCPPSYGSASHCQPQCGAAGGKGWKNSIHYRPGRVCGLHAGRVPGRRRRIRRVLRHESGLYPSGCRADQGSEANAPACCFRNKNYRG